MCVMFSPSLVRIVVMPELFSCLAASIASSRRSPGMNLTTERLTNAVRTARSRSQGLVEAQRKKVRERDIEIRAKGRGQRSEGGRKAGQGERLDKKRKGSCAAPSSFLVST